VPVDGWLTHAGAISGRGAAAHSARIAVRGRAMPGAAADGLPRRYVHEPGIDDPVVRYEARQAWAKGKSGDKLNALSP